MALTRKPIRGRVIAPAALAVLLIGLAAWVLMLVMDERDTGETPYGFDILERILVPKRLTRIAPTTTPSEHTLWVSWTEGESSVLAIYVNCDPDDFAASVAYWNDRLSGLRNLPESRVVDIDQLGFQLIEDTGDDEIRWQALRTEPSRLVYLFAERSISEDEIINILRSIRLRDCKSTVERSSSEQ